MKRLLQSALITLLPLTASAAQPWQEITMPTVADAAATFANPPREYSAIHWAIWGGLITKDRILTDIENINASGGGIYMINNSGSLQPKYLSPEYMDLVKYVVDECKKRGMKVWIEGDGGYPDGFAGGIISKDYPQLGMQGIIPDCHYTVAAGQTLAIPLPSDTLGIYAINRGAAAAPAAPAAAAQDAQTTTKIPVPPDGKLVYLSPSGVTSDVVVHSPAGDGHYSLVPGQTLRISVPPDTTAIEAGPRTGGGRGTGRGGRGGAGQPVPTLIPVPTSGQFSWTAPATGTWELTFIRHTYRSSPTRYSDRDDGTRDKDSLYTLIDYLDPAATATYLKVVHGEYEKVVGDEFGKTVLGFRLDESDYTGLWPWTPKLLETFKARKGYDLQPCIAEMFATPNSQESRRVKADYWDVWSGMFRDNFYKPLQDWARARGMDYMGHLNHEETMLSPTGGEGMISNEGSFWRDMRYMGVPGVDNLNQIGPGITADFPKLAVSAAHVNGHPLVWEEEGGSTGQNGKFIADYQFVRGMNYMNYRGLNFAAPSGALLNPAAATGWYMTRTQHLLAIGRPAAQIAFFHPTDSYWLGDQEADTVNVKLVTELMAHQIDFDHVDADALESTCTLDGGQFTNLSGQTYRAVIVPTCSVIDRKMLDRLRAFASAGGKVIFVGRTPSLVIDQTYLHPEPDAPDLSFATLEPTAEITDKVIAALPRPDVKLDAACPSVTYIHRKLTDGDVYFFFNESAEPQTRTAALDGSGQIQIWDATTGTIHPLAGVAPATGSATVPLALAGHEAKFIVIGALPAGAATTLATLVGAQNLAALDGEWSITLGDKQSTSPLKSWQDLGATGFTGIADYKKDFTLPPPVQGQRIYIDLGNVHEVAQVTINGKDLAARGWSPFVWDITDAIKPGPNTLEVKVQLPAAGGRGGGGGGGRAARAGAGAGPGNSPTTNPAGATRAGGRGRGRGAVGAGNNGGGFGTGAPQSTSGLLGPVHLVTTEPK